MSRAEHIEQLAHDFGAKLRLHSALHIWLGVTGRASFNDVLLLVEIHGWDPENDQFSYFMGLHEMGHIALGHIAGSYTRHCRMYKDRVLDAEAEAWMWAFEHALEEPDESTLARAFGKKAYGSYVREHGWHTAGVFARELASRFSLDLAAAS